ncbi:MAG: DUF1801 domain-containing protein [Methanoregulaceae archaeon]|jgi:uncharacterized protein YdhG (YjbR/CyaY superfamily)|nr:DUF1801 domain-containing protein [Methanoregulaceae archaeon]MCU0628103.1 DUF1801 domain-containing protein [Methanoregulaceae archaeon]
MTTPGKRCKTIDEYIDTFPPDVQNILGQLRKTIHEIVPQAEETIRYGIPTFTLNGNLVHFAAFEDHIGFYPTPSAIVAFKKELSLYRHAKGSVQFPINEPIPFDLVRRIVQFRVKENLEGGTKKK